jgi:hypothetical protein
MWAFGTSIHGLGLKARDLWNLTPREYYALEDVQRAETKRWAVHMAMMLNSNLGPGSVPFIADDFLGIGNREERVRKKKASDYAVNRINRQLNTMLKRPLRKGEPEPTDIPLWAMKNPPKPQPEAVKEGV